MRDIKHYRVFSKSHQLSVEIYRAVSKFPKDETFGLISQIRPSAYSIPINLLEVGAPNSSREMRNTNILTMNIHR